MPSPTPASQLHKGLLHATLATFSAWVTIVACLITLITFLRVQRLSSARKAERELLAKALRLRDINASIAADAATLSGNATPLQQETLKLSLVQMSAELEAATRILVPELKPSDLLEDIHVHKEGYWTDAFANEIVGKVRRRLDIITWRNSRALSVGLLESMLRQLEKYPTLRIRIFAVACDASEGVFESMSRMLTLGDARVMKRDQEHFRGQASDILGGKVVDGTLQPEVVNRLKYYETRTGPILHCILADDDVYWGVNFFMDPGSGATELLNRAYIQASARSEFGKKVQEQVVVLEKLASTSVYRFV